MEEVGAHADRKVLMEVDEVIVDDPQGILGQHLRPHTTHLLHIIIIIITLISHQLLNYTIQLTTRLPEGRSTPPLVTILAISP